MSKNAEFPEGRPVNEWGVPIPTPQHSKAVAIEEARIAREKAAYEQGFAGGNSNSNREEAKQRARGRSR